MMNNNGEENWDSTQSQNQRVTACQQKIRDAMKEFDCVLLVRSLHIATGQIIPEISVVPAPPKPQRPNIVVPTTNINPKER